MTTHDPRGGGRPRLIFAPGDTAPQHASQREFDLVPSITVIGSGPDADLRLEGLDAHHAEIRRDERDEYIYVDLGSHAPGRVDGQAISGKPLRTGDRIGLGTGRCRSSGKSSPIMASPSADATAATASGTGRAAATWHFPRRRQRPDRRRSREYAALAVFYGVHRSTITRAVGEIR